MKTLLYSLLLILLLSQARAAFPTLPIQRAEIKQINSVPVLTLNGQPTSPLVFFFNNQVAEGPRRQYWEPQVKMAAEAGIHIYSFVLPLPFDAKSSGIQYINAILDPFIAADPHAVFIPRIDVDASPAWLASHPQEQIVTADGSRGPQTIASVAWTSNTLKILDEFIGALEASPYGQRIIGYHLSGQTAGEWFPHLYRESGPDIGSANTSSFRSWLAAQYKTDRELQKAWNSTTVTLATASVPVPSAGRFPIHNIADGVPFKAFYDFQLQYAWIDYSRYTSELTAKRLLDFAALVKRKTQRRKLTVFFYGYNLELPGSMNGHNELMALLNSSDVDVLASPLSYQDRLRGESTGFMAAVDTIAAHGKLWIIENDMRTHLWTREHQPAEIADNPAFISELSFMPRSRDSHETVELLRRDFAAMLIHRTGTWWMDLAAVGSFQDPNIWSMLKSYVPLYDALYRDPQPFRPEVALIADEQSRNYEQSDWDISNQLLINTRHELGKSGVSFGTYLIEDFEAGRIPPCKAYIFANAFALDASRIQAIRQRLEQHAATAIWLYAPGWIHGHANNLEAMQQLTGMHIVRQDGLLGSVSNMNSTDMVWGIAARNLDEIKTFNISPRFVVDDPKAEILGNYISDRKPSLACKLQGKATHIFIGDIGVTSDLLRALFAKVGVHLWSAQPLAIHAGNGLLSVHAADAGIYEIIPPRGMRLQPQQGRVLGKGVQGGILVAFGRAQTILFDVVSASAHVE
jgi:hypothetical protein